MLSGIHVYRMSLVHCHDRKNDSHYYVDHFFGSGDIILHIISLFKYYRYHSASVNVYTGAFLSPKVSIIKLFLLVIIWGKYGG
jgi:hypothetical protein